MAIFAKLYNLFNRRETIGACAFIVMCTLAIVGVVIALIVNYFDTPFQGATLSPQQTRTPALLLTVVHPLGIQTIEDLERYLRFEIPPSAKNTEWLDYNISLQEAAINLRFESDPTSVELFLKSASFSEPLREQFYPFNDKDLFVMHYFSWWKPQAAEKFAGAVVSKGPQELWSVLVDKSVSDIYKVYFMALLM